MRKKLTPDCIRVGESLAWDLVNEGGKVLFKQGFSVHTESVRKRLLSIELYYDVATPQDPAPAASQPATDTHQPTNPFAAIDHLAEWLAPLFTSITTGQASNSRQLQTLIEDTRRCYHENPSTCIAAIHFRHNHPIANLHPIYSLFLSELLAEPLKYDPPTRFSQSAAALTANLGMFALHHRCCDHERPLDETEKKQLQAHPLKSAELLRSCGVSDRTWLTIVEQHHERRDGTGYPHGIGGKQILPPSLVVQLIDRYLSFVMPRGQRKIAHPTQALRILYEDENAIDRTLVSAMIKALGVYPPGTPVKLSNGEIAVVTRHETAHAKHPHVVSVARGINDYLQEPLARDTSDAKFSVTGLHHYDPDVEASHPATRVTDWSQE